MAKRQGIGNAAGAFRMSNYPATATEHRAGGDGGYGAGVGWGRIKSSFDKLRMILLGMLEDDFTGYAQE